ncbi:MAG: 50S ribosomal protein L29 [Spirochaetales bacterium]|uniref:Large ribosomal subunit protein uL29 n=1 Tax=Candidatus Thalassospirochaeta sargassi TaxID=3119039 RepID=A0AAJ1IF45_9SPIO|nr:50S ribosomal protein L29 [Spirochaetales bacterium]
MKDSFNDLTYEELLNKREELKKKHMDSRFSKVLGHVESPIEVRTVRRQITRLNTIIHEYSLGIRKA